MKKRTPRNGYIAIARNIFDHHLFDEERSFSRLEAWIWLIKETAWKPQGQRTRRGTAHLERGQAVTAVRDLGKTWGWPKSNVARFLSRLVDEGMIRIKKARVNITPGTVTGTAAETAISVIELCNYDEFQLAEKSLGQRTGQSAGQCGQEALPFQGDAAANQLNQSNHESRVEVADRGSNRAKPHHGAKGRGMVWLDHGTDEWKIYAADFCEATGAEKLPETRRGGRGNWFRQLGEPKRKRG